MGLVVRFGLAKWLGLRNSQTRPKEFLQGSSGSPHSCMCWAEEKEISGRLNMVRFRWRLKEILFLGLDWLALRTRPLAHR